METMIHATSLSYDGLGIMVRGVSGAGKSDLALRLIHRGGILVSDDQTRLALDDDQNILMSAPAALEGQLEVRGFGIHRTPFQNHVPLSLVLDLTGSHHMDRLPEPTWYVYSTVHVPRFDFYPFDLSWYEKISLIMQHVKHMSLP